MAGHHVAEDLLAVVGFSEKLLFFGTRVVFVDFQDFVEVVKLEFYGALHGEIDQVIVEEGDAVFEAVGHG